MTLSTSELTKLALAASSESHDEQTARIVEGIQMLQVYATVFTAKFDGDDNSPFDHSEYFARSTRELLEILEA
jgi:hypothetical protein